MKKFVCMILVLVMALSLVACGGEGGAAGKSEGGFQVGFGKIDITPEKPVHLASYGDADTRISEGALHPLYALAVVMRDEDGKTVALVTTDLSQGGHTILNEVRPLVEERFGIPSDCVLIGGTHNHNAPDYGYNDEYDLEWKEVYKNGVLDAIQMGIDDLAPATVEVGRTETENVTFVRRYLLANGEWSGDNSNYNHNSTIVSHESEADEEIQLVRFVREGEHKDIIMVNWQSHAAKHGHTNMMSADYPGALRDKVEADLDAHCVFYQGAAGNLNPSSRIPGEAAVDGSGYEAAVKVGELVASEAIEALTTEGVMKEIQTGKIQTNQGKFIAETAWDESNVITCGDLSFVTLPVEFFDSLGVMIKEGTPFEMTVLMGYHCGNGQYLSSYEGYLHGGYGPTNTRYRAGDGEKFVEYYLELLNQLFETK